MNFSKFISVKSKEELNMNKVFVTERNKEIMENYIENLKKYFKDLSEEKLFIIINCRLYKLLYNSKYNDNIEKMLKNIDDKIIKHLDKS